MPQNDNTEAEEKISVSTVSIVIKKMVEKSLRLTRKPLLSAATVQKGLERSTRFLNDLKKEGNWILHFSDEKIFTVDLVFNKQYDRIVTFGIDDFEHRKVSTIKHRSSLHYDAWRRSIERWEDASGLVWTELQANLCRLQRNIGDERFFMSQEAN